MAAGRQPALMAAVAVLAAVVTVGALWTGAVPGSRPDAVAYQTEPGLVAVLPLQTVDPAGETWLRQALADLL